MRFRWAASVFVVGALVAASGVVIAQSSSADPLVTGASPYVNKPSTTDRYSLVHGCFSVTLSDGVKRGPYRMQATTLGQYLLYSPNKTFLGATAASSGLLGLGGQTTSLSDAPAPGKSTEWQVDGTTNNFTLTNLGTGYKSAVSFGAAQGCADYPEIGVSATGNTFKGTNPNGPVTGTIDAHTHVTGFELFGGDFHCGRPWHPYGAPYALPDCAPYEQGSNGQVESFEDYGTPAHAHDTRGWPTFAEWPGANKLAEEGTYWTGIERAWLAGLRIMTVDYVDNEALCDVMTTKHNPCNDMISVQNQWNDLHALQNYIDAQAGGPGKGFFRIVTSPAEARQVANAGKLAVIQGIEVSDIMNCGEIVNIPKCSAADVDSWMTRLWGMGIRSFFPVHKFDNAIGGTKMDAGQTGVLSNVGNNHETGTFWNVNTCTGPMHDEQQLAAVPVGSPLASLLSGAYASILGGALLPVYPAAPHCNQRGLTDIGAYVITQMMNKHFVIELDHMDVITAQAVLAMLNQRHYSGVVSSHSWDSPEQNTAIYALGGFVTPYAGDPSGFVDAWKSDLAQHSPNYAFGIGYGSDMNGLGAQGGPTSAHPIPYPFTAYQGGVKFNRDVWGQKTFDLNTDGTANYGLYADWLQELSQLGGPAIMKDMFNGAEAYLQMWTRASA